MLCPLLLSRFLSTVCVCAHLIRIPVYVFICMCVYMYVCLYLLLKNRLLNLRYITKDILLTSLQ